VVVVFTILVKPVLKSDAVDDCHLTILPVCPLKVKLIELAPLHTLALPDILPPTLVGFTVMVTTFEVSESAFVVLATRRKYVVCVSAPGL